MNPDSPLGIAVLISGAGTTLRNLLEKQRAGELDVDFRVVISSHPGAPGLEYARQANIPSHVVVRRRAASDDAFGQAVFDLCRRYSVQLVVMAGFLKFVPIPDDFFGRVMNIHPALVPAFCGQGLYGSKVHQAVLDYGVKISGCTVHFADNQYDHGPVILQQAVPVLDDDTVQTLAARVFAAECELYPEAIRLFAAGRLEIMGRKVKIRS